MKNLTQPVSVASLAEDILSEMTIVDVAHGAGAPGPYWCSRPSQEEVAYEYRKKGVQHALAWRALETTYRGWKTTVPTLMWDMACKRAWEAGSLPLDPCEV